MARRQRKQQPLFQFHSRYLKDSSFERHNPPSEQEPEITINTKVGGSVTDNLYEIELRVMVTCEVNLKIQFIAEVTYAGLFEVQSADEDQMAHFIYIAAPELLFVHAQRVMMDMVRDGGFPALSLATPDFESAWRLEAANQQHIELDLSPEHEQATTS